MGTNIHSDIYSVDVKMLPSDLAIMLVVFYRIDLFHNQIICHWENNDAQIDEVNY